MANMGKYCKAYMIDRFRAYPSWRENSENTRVEKAEGSEEEAPRVLGEDSFLYLQENYTVTDGIYLDENVIFDDVTDEWKKYCDETLGFEIPVYEPIEIKSAEPESKDEVKE